MAYFRTDPPRHRYDAVLTAIEDLIDSTDRRPYLSPESHNSTWEGIRRALTDLVAGTDNSPYPRSTSGKTTLDGILNALTDLVNDGDTRPYPRSTSPRHPHSAWLNSLEDLVSGDDRSPYANDAAKGTLQSIILAMGDLVSSGGLGARIAITGTTLPENTSLGGTGLIMSVVGLTGPFTWAITVDADNKFAIAGGAANTKELQIDNAFNYETKTSHAYTVTADDGVNPVVQRTITIDVSNILEVTLAALSLDDSTVADSATIGTVVGAIQDATSGSTLSLIDDDGGKYALDSLNVEVAAALTAGSDSITIRETHLDASNSPRDTVIGITVTVPSDGYVPTYHILGF